METTDIVDFARRDRITDALTDLLRTGAQQLIATTVEAEFASYLVQFSDLRTDTGHAAVVRNGHHPARPVQTGIGPVSVRIPKERHQTVTSPVTFRSALMRPYVRRTKTLEATLPRLYLKGISSGEMGAGLKGLLGPDAAGLSTNTVSRLRCYLSGACKAGCRKGAIGPWNTMAGNTLRTMTSQSSTSGPTASTAAFEASTISYAPKLAIGPFHRLQADGCRAVDGAMGLWAVLDEVYLSRNL
jgi:hypothetical protein